MKVISFQPLFSYSLLDHPCVSETVHLPPHHSQFHLHRHQKYSNRHLHHFMTFPCCFTLDFDLPDPELCLFLYRQRILVLELLNLLHQYQLFYILSFYLEHVFQYNILLYYFKFKLLWLYPKFLRFRFYLRNFVWDVNLGWNSFLCCLVNLISQLAKCPIHWIYNFIFQIIQLNNLFAWHYPYLLLFVLWIVVGSIGLKVPKHFHFPLRQFFNL